MGWHRDNERELGPEPLIASSQPGRKKTVPDATRERQESALEN